jgi:hypothetical protein
MSKGNTFERDLLQLLLNATPISQIADNASSSAAVDIWASLHSADPGETGTQGTNEVGYTGYTRIAVTRSTDGFSITTGGTAGASAAPRSAISFPQNTSTSTGTISHFALGLSSGSTAGKLFYKGTVTPNISFAQNVTPRLTTASSFRED